MLHTYTYTHLLFPIGNWHWSEILTTVARKREINHSLPFKMQCVCVCEIMISKRYKTSYLHAKTKSALWFGPTYLYSARASQTTSKKVSRLTTTVVRVLYISNGTLLLLWSFPETVFLEASDLLGETFSIPSGSKASHELTFLINSKTRWLIWSKKKKIVNY